MTNQKYLTDGQVHSHNYIEVLWNGDANLDLDLFAVLLDKDGKLIDDRDFVFYNSENRTEPYTPNKWHNRNIWRDRTLPISVDGSVYAIGEPIDENDDWGEGMFVYLFKTRPEIHEIKFILAVYDDGRSTTLRGIKSIKVRFKQHGSSEAIYSFDINGGFTNERVISVCSLQRTPEENWYASNSIIGFANIQSFLDYISR